MKISSIHISPNLNCHTPPRITRNASSFSHKQSLLISGRASFGLRGPAQRCPCRFKSSSRILVTAREKGEKTDEHPRIDDFADAKDESEVILFWLSLFFSVS